MIVGDGLFFHSLSFALHIYFVFDGRITLSLRLTKSMHKQCIHRFRLILYNSDLVCFALSLVEGLHGILLKCVSTFVGVVHAAIIFDRPFHIRSNANPILFSSDCLQRLHSITIDQTILLNSFFLNLIALIWVNCIVWSKIFRLNESQARTIVIV